jgi:hypothetical protein
MARRLVPLLLMAIAVWWLWPTASIDPVDRTRISAGVTRHAPVVLQLAYTAENGGRERVLVDAQRYTAFVRRAVAQLEADRVALGDSLAEHVAARTAPAFDSMAAGVGAFVDWYLGPSTGVKLLLAAGSAWRPGHSMDAAVRGVVTQNYRERVLRPERHDAALRDAFLELLRDTEQHRDTAMRAIDRDFLAFVTAERQRGVQGTPVVELDWSFQARRLDLPTPANVVAPPVRDEIAVRLVGPAIGLLVAASTGAATGASLGSFAAPVGALAGVGAAVVTDRIIAALRRGDIERDVLTALAATRDDWRAKMRDALSEAVDVWFDDAIQSLPSFDQNGRRALSAAVNVPSSR